MIMEFLYVRFFDKFSIIWIDFFLFNQKYIIKSIQHGLFALLQDPKVFSYMSNSTVPGNKVDGDKALDSLGEYLYQEKRIEFGKNYDIAVTMTG